MRAVKSCGLHKAIVVLVCTRDDSTQAADGQAAGQADRTRL